MRTFSAALEAQTQLSTTTWCHCWRITRRDAVVQGFTDLDTDITVAGVLYRASTGMTTSALSTKAAYNVDTVEASAFTDAVYVKAADLDAGLYDGAQVTLLKVNYTAPQDGGIILRTGELGQISRRDEAYTAELRGLMYKMQVQVPRVIAPTCDADLGDLRCGVNLPALTVAGTATSVQAARTAFTDTGRAEVTNYFRFGLVTWTGGANNGRRVEVKTHAAGGVFTLALPMATDIQVGDTFTVSPGCDKLRATCRDKFSNIINFRGFPDLPGRDRVLRIVGRD